MVSGATTKVTWSTLVSRDIRIPSLSQLSALESCQNALRRKWEFGHPHAGSVKEGVRDGARGRCHHFFARARRALVQALNHHRRHLRAFLEAQDRVDGPI